MRRRILDWLDRHRLDDVSYEEDHPYAAAATRMGAPAADFGFISWLIWVVLDSSGYYRWRARRRRGSGAAGKADVTNRGANVPSYVHDATDRRVPDPGEPVLRLPLPGEPAGGRFPLRDGMAVIFELPLEGERDMVPDPPASWVGDMIYQVTMARHDIDQAAVESQAIDGKPWPRTLIFGDRDEALAWARAVAAAVALNTRAGMCWSAGSRRLSQLPEWPGHEPS